MKKDRTIAVLPVHNLIAGNGSAAILLVQCIFWHARNKHPEKHFYKTAGMWCKELGFRTPSQVYSARKRLKSLGLLSWYQAPDPKNPNIDITWYIFHPERYQEHVDFNNAEQEAADAGKTSATYQPKNDAPKPSPHNFEDLIIPNVLKGYDPAQILQKLDFLKTPPEVRPLSIAQLCLDAVAYYADYLRKAKNEAMEKPLDSLFYMVNEYNHGTLKTDGAHKIAKERKALADTKAKAKQPPAPKHKPPPKENHCDALRAAGGLPSRRAH